MTTQPNTALEPTAVGAVRSATRFTSGVGGGLAWVRSEGLPSPL